MHIFSLTQAIIVASCVCLIQAAPAQAQATRTWVSGVGDDVNPCSRTAPCKTWAGAISKTAAGGEIDALDPGGFGGVTITKAITLDGGGGPLASILVAGTPGITVAAGVNDVVAIRNLSINGVGSGTHGIRFVSGATLIVDRCDIFSFLNNGVDIALTASGNALIRNTTIHNVGGNGVNVTTSSGAALVLVSESSFEGPFASGAFSGGGVNASTGGDVTVRNSTFNTLAFGAQASGNGNLTVDSSMFSTDVTGIGSAASTTVAVTNNTIVNNNNPLQVAGTFLSAGNNKIIGGGAPGTPTGAITLK